MKQYLRNHPREDLGKLPKNKIVESIFQQILGKPKSKIILLMYKTNHSLLPYLYSLQIFRVSDPFQKALLSKLFYFNTYFTNAWNWPAVSHFMNMILHSFKMKTIWSCAFRNTFVSLIGTGEHQPVSLWAAIIFWFKMFNFFLLRGSYWLSLNSVAKELNSITLFKLQRAQKSVSTVVIPLSCCIYLPPDT